MKKLKVIFFGTPDFARASLEAIFNSHHEVVGVVTVADKASGRGMKTNESPVKKFAIENNLPLFQPLKLRDPKFLEDVRNLEADVFVVVAFRMMPKILFSIPPLGTFNIHASLLPDYRGAAPINFAIINGESQSGVTSFFINEKIDEGHILLQEKTKIEASDNAGVLHDKLMELGAELAVKTLNGLAEGTLKEIPQPEVLQPKKASKIFKEDLIIHWDQAGENVYNFIRGMSPYPVAFTTLRIGDEDKIFKIFEGKYQTESHNEVPGTLKWDKDRMIIFTSDGIYFPEIVQLAGKKRMSVKDFLNGLQSSEQIQIIS